jgi:hypothetical protein
LAVIVICEVVICDDESVVTCWLPEAVSGAEAL